MVRLSNRGARAMILDFEHRPSFLSLLCLTLHAKVCLSHEENAYTSISTLEKSNLRAHLKRKRHRLCRRPLSATFWNAHLLQLIHPQLLPSKQTRQAFLLLKNAQVDCLPSSSNARARMKFRSPRKRTRRKSRPLSKAL